ncbi:MAG TPA: RES family NAD+ phosphorylase [Rhizomicrobium sp.]|jgi:hypothetical protein
MAVKIPPASFVVFNTVKLPKGTALVRVHDPIFSGAEANPCKGGASRFAPIATPAGDCVPTLYAADDFEAAVHGSLFHQIPHKAKRKTIRLSSITSRSVSWLVTGVDLKLAMLNEPDLNLINMSRKDLIDTAPKHYSVTARWAEAFHRADRDLAGLMWTSKRCDPRQAYVFFGDRLSSGAITTTKRVDLATSAHEVGEIRQFGFRAGITIVLAL